MPFEGERSRQMKKQTVKEKAEHARNNVRRNGLLSLVVATFVASAIAIGLSGGDAKACSYNPCLYHTSQAPKTIIKKVIVYVPSDEMPDVVVKRKHIRKKVARTKPVVRAVSEPVARAVSECEFIPFSHGYASQPVVFFRYKADARCQEAKQPCSVCKDWINKKRGPVFGPAARTGGGEAYSIPQGSTGVSVPRNNKGVIAYCDQAVGNDTYSWGVKE